MPLAGPSKGFERQPRYCGTGLNKAYLPPEKIFLRRRPFNDFKSLVLTLQLFCQIGKIGRSSLGIVVEVAGEGSAIKGAGLTHLFPNNALLKSYSFNITFN